MRRHKDPTKCPKPGRQPKHRRPPQPRQPPQARGRCTRYVALHPIWGTAPVTWRCTRYVAVHPNRRGALPTDRVQCPNKQEQTRNWHTEPLTATPLHAHLGPTGGRMGTPPTPPPALQPTPAHSGPTRHLLHPYMRRARLPIRIQPPTSAIAGGDYMPQRADRRARESGARRPLDQQPSA